VHHLNQFLKPIIDEYEASREWKEIAIQAYPPDKVAPKVKDKGDPALRAATAAARKVVVAKPDGHVEGPGAKK
jgi:tyrosyl-tRNA synthetase